MPGTSPVIEAACATNGFHRGTENWTIEVFNTSYPQNAHFSDVIGAHDPKLATVDLSLVIGQTIATRIRTYRGSFTDVDPIGLGRVTGHIVKDH